MSEQTAIDEMIAWLEKWEKDVIEDYKAMRHSSFGGEAMMAVHAQRNTIREALEHARAAKQREEGKDE